MYKDKLHFFLKGWKTRYISYTSIKTVEVHWVFYSWIRPFIGIQYKKFKTDSHYKIHNEIIVFNTLTLQVIKVNNLNENQLKGELKSGVMFILDDVASLCSVQDNGLVIYLVKLFNKKRGEGRGGFIRWTFLQRLTIFRHHE